MEKKRLVEESEMEKKRLFDESEMERRHCLKKVRRNEGD